MIAAGVIRANELLTPLVWIEHWPEETTEGKETFELVVFSSYNVEQRTPCAEESMDRGRYVEDTGPYSSGIVGR